MRLMSALFAGRRVRIERAGRPSRGATWALLLVALAIGACSSDDDGTAAKTAAINEVSDRGSVLLESRFVNAAGAGVPDLRIQVSVVPTTPGLNYPAMAASGTTDRDGRFTAASVPVEALKGASVGASVRFMVTAFGVGTDGARWGCTFSRVPRSVPDTGPVAWEEPALTLVFRPDATCAP